MLYWNGAPEHVRACSVLFIRESNGVYWHANWHRPGPPTAARGGGITRLDLLSPAAEFDPDACEYRLPGELTFRLRGFWFAAVDHFNV